MADHLQQDASLSKVLKLAPYVGGLITVATDPAGWAANNLEDWIKTLVAEWFAEGVLDALQWVVGWILYSFGSIRGEILQAAGPLTSPYLIVEQAIVGMIETLYAVPRGIADMAGLAGPPAAAFSVALLSAFLAATAYALYYVLINWIPGGGILDGLEENLDS